MRKTRGNKAQAERPVPGEETLDPADWPAFTRLAHAALDECLDYLAAVRERPVWQAVPEETRALLREPVPHRAADLDQVLEDFRRRILPYATGNVHPRFFGWVHGAGTPVGVLAEMLAATMNSNCGGRDHSAIYVERQVIEWCREIFGLPAGSSGVLTVGTSMASVIAVSVARNQRLGAQARRDGNGSRRLVGYCSSEAHVALRKAFELLGLGSAQLRALPAQADFSLPLPALAAAIAADRAAGLEPFLLVGTAGTVNTGAYDDLPALAELAARENLWFHVDGAFGAWAQIAGAPWNHLVRGIERADSLAFDFHKWIAVPYDAGCVLVRDGRAHHAAFAERPDYLASSARGLAGGDHWPCDYGIDLSRGFRALKVWMALRHYGVDQLGRMIAKNCQAAQHLGVLIEQSNIFELAAPVTLNICCFRWKEPGAQGPGLTEPGAEEPVPGQHGAPGAAEDGDRRIVRLVEQLQISGIAAPSTARIHGRLCVRVAVLNHRTAASDLERLLAAAQEIASAQALR